jgi:hypothetical protein
MLLYLNADIRIGQFLVSQRLQYHRVLRHKHSAELLLYLQFDPHEHAHLVVALTLPQEEAHLLLLILLLLLVVLPSLLLLLTILSDVLRVLLDLLASVHDGRLFLVRIAF